MSRTPRRRRLTTAAVAIAIAVVGAACRPAAPKPPPPAKGLIHTGSSFDACTAPSTSTMQAWLASPYRAIGVYIGGANRGCSQLNLTASWVDAVETQGWKLLPLYVGSQAPTGCNSPNYSKRITAANAAAQGVAEADDAVAQAQNLTIGPGSPIYLDMEAYSRVASCTNPVRTFVSAWVGRVQSYGYLAGFYSSGASGVADQVEVVQKGLAYKVPDELFFANWNNKATVFGDPYVPDSMWANHQRHHQYRGGHDETWGGVKINIDSTASDGAVAGRTT